MSTRRTILTVGVMLALACPLLAAAPKKAAEKKAPPCPAAQLIERLTEGMTFSDAQKAKLEELKKEYGPKLMEARKGMEVLTDDQKKARAEAMKKAAADGKKGADLRAASEAAVKLSDEQKTKMAEARKALMPLEKELRDKLTAVLTEEQKAQIKAKLPAGRKKPAK